MSKIIISQILQLFKFHILLFELSTTAKFGYKLFMVIKMDEKHMRRLKLIGLKIAYYRKLRGLSQMRLAEKINISRTHMSRIETALCEAPLHVLFDIADVLDFDVRDLFIFDN